MTLVPNEKEQALNQQYDVYAAAREEYRKKIAEQAARIERLEAWNEEIAINARHFAEALRYIAWEQKEGDEPHLIARAALEGK